jgi:chorismate-pyruvate lyase
MNDPDRSVSPDLGELFAEFPPADDLPDYELVPPDDVPEPYHTLLVHEHHMTVTVEAHHGAPVDVRILARRHNGDRYARKIVLTPQGSNRVVLFGIVRIHLGYCDPEVRQAIVEGKTPLGRILIEHDVLRRIEISAYLRIQPGPKQLAWFGLTEPTLFYGRLGFIHCDGKPAVELLEVVVPE